MVVGAALSADVDAPTERVHSAPGARRGQSLRNRIERAGRECKEALVADSVVRVGGHTFGYRDGRRLVCQKPRRAKPPGVDTICSAMSKSFTAPPSIRQIAARRVYRAASGTRVVVTLGVPQPVPGSDWGCPLQITGLNTIWRRPRYVFGIDGFQALHLAMQRAGVVLEAAGQKLEWLGQTEDLGMPTFLPWLPKPQQARNRQR